MIPGKLRNAIIVVVTSVWTANFAAGFFMPGYSSDQGINAIFMAIVGGLFALGAKNDKNGNDKNGNNGNNKSEPPAAN